MSTVAVAAVVTCLAVIALAQVLQTYNQAQGETEKIQVLREIRGALIQLKAELRRQHEERDDR